MPTPAWRNQLFRKNLTDRPWTPGDNINLAVGQGDLQADPLQMAVAYSDDRERRARRHARTSVCGSRTRTAASCRRSHPGRSAGSTSRPTTRNAIMSGLRAAANDPGGTSEPVFGGFPIEVAGKTGTAERGAQGDQSWYVAMAPYNDPRIVVAVTIERGGFGAEAAAPAARADPRRLLRRQGQEGRGHGRNGAPN